MAVHLKKTDYEGNLKVACKHLHKKTRLVECLVLCIEVIGMALHKNRHWQRGSTSSRSSASPVLGTPSQWHRLDWGQIESGWSTLFGSISGYETIMQVIEKSYQILSKRLFERRKSLSREQSQEVALASFFVRSNWTLKWPWLKAIMAAESRDSQLERVALHCQDK
eukprot:4702185-Amphidinium_carterae.1